MLACSSRAMLSVLVLGEEGFGRESRRSVSASAGWCVAFCGMVGADVVGCFCQERPCKSESFARAFFARIRPSSSILGLKIAAPIVPLFDVRSPSGSRWGWAGRRW